MLPICTNLEMAVALASLCNAGNDEYCRGRHQIEQGSHHRHDNGDGLVHLQGVQGRGSTRVRISEFFGFQWQNLTEILSLFKKYNNLGQVSVREKV